MALSRGQESRGTSSIKAEDYLRAHLGEILQWGAAAPRPADFPDEPAFMRALCDAMARAADSGYVSAWYLDEDYVGDCFVDCQMFLDFKKAPNIKASLKAEVDPEEFTLKLASEPFPARGYKRIAVKVVDLYGNESTVVKEVG